jgi:SAM-dependent methyltransferase
MANSRSPERLAAHYSIERELADRLRAAPREARSKLYTAVYDELFERVTDHPGLTKRTDAAMRAAQVDAQLALLGRYLHPEATFLEIGAGDAALSLAIARVVRSAVAVDVSRTIPENAELPANFRLHISHDTDLGVADGSVTLAYSNQLLEHLHPDDAMDHLMRVVAALAKGGTYVCATPNRLTGPHDISQYFDTVATGLHLKEYSGGELQRLFKAAGFSRFEWHTGVRGRFHATPMWAVRMTESLLEAMPWRLRRPLARQIPFRIVLSGTVVAAR